MGNAKALFVAHNDEDYCARSHRRLEDQSRHRPRLRPRRQLPQAVAHGPSEYEREHGGVQLNGREDMNELRDAIAGATPAASSRR